MSDLFSSRKKIIFITSYYDGFIKDFYQKNPTIAMSPYQVQLQALTGSFFGDSDFYSEGIRKCGWIASDIIYNCSELQQKWAEENGISQRSLLEILIEQIKKEKPEVVYIHNFLLATEPFINQIRPHTRLIVGQIASAVPVNSNPKLFDIIFTSFPHFVSKFRDMGITTYYQPLAFDQRVWNRLKEYHIPKDVRVSFVGGISSQHMKGIILLDKIINKTPFHIWGYGKEILPDNTLLKRLHHGEVWGLEMFATLARSKITLNRHIDSAENHANNMRLFEATGCGSLLLTDMKDNLSDFFEIDKEIITYQTPEEAVEKIIYYQAHPEEAEKIALAGQIRTFKDHSYEQRMEQTAEILELHLERANKFSENNNENPVSSGYVQITKDDVTEEMTSAWKDINLPKYQRQLVNKELGLMYQNKIVLPYQTMANALDGVLKNKDKLLEIGCASGYYSEVIPYLTGKRCRYTGVDYSSSLIKMAKDYYPSCDFYEADGSDLPFKNNLFDVVISSCILLHVPNYIEHINETVRVAKNYVIASRTPLCKLKETHFLSKMAYGVKMVELCFNEQELLNLFLSQNLRLVKKIQLSENLKLDQYVETWVFKKEIH